MDKAEIATLEKELDDADRHVAKGARLIERQRSSIEQRQRDGHDHALATDLLGEMEEAQRNHVVHRNLIRRELVIAEGKHAGERRDMGLRN